MPDEALGAGNTLCIPKDNNEVWCDLSQKDEKDSIRDSY